MLPMAKYYYGQVLSIVLIVFMLLGCYGSIHGKTNKIRNLYSALIFISFAVFVYVVNVM